MAEKYRPYSERVHCPVRHDSIKKEFRRHEQKFLQLICV